MKSIKRLLTASTVALIICVLFSTLVLAATNYVSEQSSGFTGSNLSSASGCTLSTCKGSDAKYANQSTNGTVTASGNWYTATANVTQWKTYIPNLSGDWAGVIYKISNSTLVIYPTTVNQNNWKGSYVNVGTFSNNSTWAQMNLPNTCVTNYACDGRQLYFDQSEYYY